MQSYQYLVFVRCFTYNHELYTEDALNGFAMQQTNFPYVVAVVDDASTDNNALVITEWISKNCDNKENYYVEDKDYGKVIQAQAKCNPNCIFYVILLKENHCRKKSRRPYYAQFEDSSKYIAICEGDDYWIDRHKLQKQVDFLEAHPDYQLVFHNAIVHYEDTQIPDCVMKTFCTGTFSTAQIFELWQLPYASVVYRSTLEDTDVFRDFMKVRSGGFAHFLAASMLGKVYGIADGMSIYRKHDGGMSKTMSLAQCLDIDNRMAIASGDKESIEVRRKRTIDILTQNMTSLLLRRESTKGLWGAAKKFDRKTPYIALVRYTLDVPLRILRKIKRRIIK